MFETCTNSFTGFPCCFDNLTWFPRGIFLVRISVISLDIFPQVVAVPRSSDLDFFQTFMKCPLLLYALAVKFCPWYVVHRSKTPGTQELMFPGLENELVLTYTPRRKTERFHHLSYIEKQKKLTNIFKSLERLLVSIYV